MARLYPVLGVLADGELAIEAQDRFKFTVAFDMLTAAYNACHQSTKHAFIVIQQPISLHFNNHSFTATPQDPSDPAHHH